MKRFLFNLAFLAAVFMKANGQTTSQPVPGGTVYQTTIRNEAYKFDHAVYSLFIPEGIKEIRGIFVHQHGCTMQGIGASMAYDVQYQSFAKKWSLALVGTDLFPKPGSECGDWRNQEDGSGHALFAGLDSIANLSNFPELATAPLLLWGHSGGGYWVLSMLKDYPERIMAAVCYSPAFHPKFAYPREVAEVPILIRHAGPGDLNVPAADCWGTALNTFSKIRDMDGLVSIAYNAGQNHNFTYLRDMAIPFFESVLSHRLPEQVTAKLKKVDRQIAWLCDTTTNETPGIYKASTFKGSAKSMSLLPDSACAAKLREFIVTSRVADVTAPPAPGNLNLTVDRDSVWLAWNTEADTESGIGWFNIYKNDRLLTRYPAEGDFQTFNTNGDNPEPANPPSMSFRFPVSEVSKKDKIGVSVVNRSGLESSKTVVKAKCFYGKMLRNVPDRR